MSGAGKSTLVERAAKPRIHRLRRRQRRICRATSGRSLGLECRTRWPSCSPDPRASSCSSPVAPRSRGSFRSTYRVLLTAPEAVLIDRLSKRTTNSIRPERAGALTGACRSRGDRAATRDGRLTWSWKRPNRRRGAAQLCGGNPRAGRRPPLRRVTFEMWSQLPPPALDGMLEWMCPSPGRSTRRRSTSSRAPWNGSTGTQRSWAGTWEALSRREAGAGRGVYTGGLSARDSRCLVETVHHPRLAARPRSAREVSTDWAR